MPTRDSRILGVRLPNKIVDWYTGGNARASVILKEIYEDRTAPLDLNEFRKACDRKKIDYQMAIDRMTELINEG